MGTQLAASKIGKPLQLSFFFWMTVVMAALVFTGFGMTYFIPLATGSLPATPPIVHLHGFVFSCWMLLLMVQPLLVNLHKVNVHRSVGSFGIALAAALIVTGLLLTIMSLNSSSPDQSPDYYSITYLSLCALGSFTLLFVLAIRQIRNPASHKRLMLFATIPLLPPGINRLYMMPLELYELPLLATYLTMDVLVLAMVIHDLRSLGTVSKASLLGLSLILLQQVLHVPVAGSHVFADLNDYLASLAWYR